MGHTFVEKVLARKAGLDSVVPGQIVTVRPDKLLTHDTARSASSGWPTPMLASSCWTT